MNNAPATSSAMPLGNDAAGDGFPVDDIDSNLMAGSRYLGSRLHLFAGQCRARVLPSLL